MKVIKTKLPGVIIIEPKIFGDDRGFFFENFRSNQFSELGIDKPFVQDNVSRSARDVLRGLHHQTKHTQGKLVWVTRGKIFDAVVDIRKDYPTFGQWISSVLDDQDHRLIYVPPGLAHGFCVLSETADFSYKCTDYYDPASEITIAWNDPDIGINWPVKNPIISDKDSQGKRLKDIP
ncbi:MAG: dTDP-4-dehydrorhamnose 3,5-epimerase [Gammaproteobacteria bacterium RIFCSPHIGHO2_02_FULL_42_13]|nr:MAG: dTDP-4-dehydrorhamnose 3,5-epimerase [Gammaproteobacteria bacterium RIFCSPHIGHO2_02_FULL_42_13]